MAEWNLEKDLLATVTEDSKVGVLRRFNWQRLWTISPGCSRRQFNWSEEQPKKAVGLSKCNSASANEDAPFSLKPMRGNPPVKRNESRFGAKILSDKI
ncbi:hypothetical protein BT93_E2266 [Corymbia citriodora subsp. variegata]|nr:hypothetical protein BT93_E2266 [Corymbia citriodora subsp. variegata]